MYEIWKFQLFLRFVLHWLWLKDSVKEDTRIGWYWYSTLRSTYVAKDRVFLVCYSAAIKSCSTEKYLRIKGALKSELYIYTVKGEYDLFCSTIFNHELVFTLKPWPHTCIHYTLHYLLFRICCTSYWLVLVRLHFNAINNSICVRYINGLLEKPTVSF